METEEDLERTRENRRAAMLDSLAFVEPAQAEAKFKAFLDAHGGSVTEWDQRFFDFIARHKDARLLAGTAGGGFDFVFSLVDSAGFWVLAARDGGTGKGFLSHHDAERILELARLKGLVK